MSERPDENEAAFHMMDGPALKRVSIVFVCTGNICRSPLAEASFRDFIRRQGLAHRFLVGSAGTHALSGNFATREAREAGRRHGLDLSRHRARLIDEALMHKNDYVLAMTQRHHEWLRREFPQYKNKIYLALLFPRELKGESPQRTDIPDPIGESVEFYIEVLEMLKPALPEITRGSLGDLI